MMETDVMAYSTSHSSSSYNYNQSQLEEDAKYFNVSNLNVETILLVLFLGIFIMITIISNVFVIYAICTEKNLKGVANRLILSLAVTDLTVAILVMPVSAYNEIKHVWGLGPELCLIWTYVDILCCTASILHLLAIAIDRYWAVTNIEYAIRRPPMRIYLLIGSAWTAAAIISIFSTLGWIDSEFYERLEREQSCCLSVVSYNIAYLVFSTLTSFYIPLIFIILFYWKIFKEARKRIRKSPFAQVVLTAENNRKEKGSSDDTNETSRNQIIPTENTIPNDSGALGKLFILVKPKEKPSKESTEAKRELKAAKTLMIITGAFVLCWLPFFLMSLLAIICEACTPSDMLYSVLSWLALANSLINPVIYTIFSPDFRKVFIKILCSSRFTTQRH